MKVAILSDVHANLEALQAVERALEAEAPDEVWFLGDAVGYGPEPNECLEVLRARCSVFLMGNHDAASVGLTDASDFNVYARQAVEYTAGVLKAGNRSFLASLPYRESRAGSCLVHASPYRPEEWHYVFSAQDAERCFGQFEEGICFIGHSHFPLVFLRDPAAHVAAAVFSPFAARQGWRYLVNIGSVGQPRDGDPRAAFCVFDPALGISLRRVAYDIGAVQDKMKERGLPGYLIERLSRGR